MLKMILVEDNEKLRLALKNGLEATGKLHVVFDCATGEEAVSYCLDTAPDVALLDVQLEGLMDGIQVAAAIRREIPRLAVVFYSIQDDDRYFRAFRESGILSHYAYVRKSNYLLPEMIAPLLEDAFRGRSFIDPDIEVRVHEVSHKDRNSPMALLEPNEQVVARLLAQGLTNEQIASRLGFRDKRSVSRTNGQIYAAWGLNETATDEKVARARAVIIIREGRLFSWDAEGAQTVLDERDQWVVWNSEGTV